MIKSLLLVFIGGGLGSSLRYGFSILLNNQDLKWLPTISVNLIGCFALGLIYAATYTDKPFLTISWYLLLGTGLCGGFTTFSTFSLELFQLIKQQYFLQASIYITISVIGGIIFSSLGYYSLSLIKS